MTDRAGPSPFLLWVCHPIILAAAATLFNAAKPVVVDDTAYLAFARHIADQPLDPYGFRLFWYKGPEPAMDILAPPVVPYWLAAGIRLFGENVFLLKLWLLPFPLILAYSVRFLLRRFARSSHQLLTLAVVLGPGVLPFMNFMLDVPSLALQLTAVALVVRAGDRPVSFRLAIAAGICVGLAVQTKYSALGIPVVLAWYGISQRRLALAAVSISAGTIFFAAWEAALVAKYGISHFAHNTVGPVAMTGPATAGKTSWPALWAWLGEKHTLFVPLLSFLGATVWWIGPFVWALLVRRGKVHRWFFGLAAVMATLVVVPGQWVVLVPGSTVAGDRLSVNGLFFACLGGAAFAAGVAISGSLLFRSRRSISRFHSIQLRRNRDSVFLCGWLLLELLFYFVLTPFPAGRRVLGVSVVLVMLVGRYWSLVHGLALGPVAAWAVASGISLTALDALDAYPEKALPRHAAALAREHRWPGTGWYVGHWGFQYYCEREGIKPLIPGQSELKPGDWIVYPAYPNHEDFNRPYDGGVAFIWDPLAVVPVTIFEWDDAIAGQTIPNLYGGRVPIVSRKLPRLRIIVYRVVQPWRPIAAPRA